MSKACVFWREGKWRGDPGGVAAIAGLCEHLLGGKHCAQANGACLVRSTRIRKLAFGDFGRAPIGVPAYPPETDHTDLAAVNRHTAGTAVRKYRVVPTDDEGREIEPNVPVVDPMETIYTETLEFLHQRYPALSPA